MGNSEAPRHSSEDIDRILARALELEAASEGRITDGQLREIAADVGISTEAIDRALEEVRRAPARVAVASVVDDAARAAGVGLALGLLTSLIRPLAKVGSVHVESLVALAIMATALLLLARRAKGPSAQTRYHAGSGAMWVGFAAGFLMISGRLQGDMLLVAACGAMISAAIGGVLVRIGSASAPPRLPPASESGRQSLAPTRTLGIRRWFKRLFHLELTEHAFARLGVAFGRARA